MWKVLIAAPLLAAVLFVGASSTHAAALTEAQINAILGLLSSFGADTTVVTNVNASLRGLPTTSTGGSASATAPNVACSYVSGITRTLSEGISDATTGGQVSMLQKFLAGDSSVYPEGSATGYFGPATERAVERWQKKYGLLSSGSPETNGFGVVGSLTRAAMLRRCGNATVSPSSGGATASQDLSALREQAKSSLATVELSLFEELVSFVQRVRASSANIPKSKAFESERGVRIIWIRDTLKGYAQKDLTLLNEKELKSIVETIWLLTNDRSNILAAYNTLPASELALLNSGDTTTTPAITFFSASPTSVDPGQSSTLSWSSSGTQYGGCYVFEGSGSNSITPSSLWVASGSHTVRPGVTTTYRLWCTSNWKDGSPNVSASVTVAVVSAPTGQLNTGQKNSIISLLTSFGANQTILTQSSDAMNGATISRSGSMVLSESQVASVLSLVTSFGASSSIKTNLENAIRSGGTTTANQTNPILIYSFSASPTAVHVGSSVLFQWSSNLSATDISYWGGGCGISGTISATGQQVHVTNGTEKGATGSVTYAPTGTGTYTLTCTSGGKDGSPYATQAISVSATPQAAIATGAIATGVYEGSYPPGVYHDFNNSPEGTVYVNVTGDQGDNRDLVLTSYEPVNWIVNVPAGVKIGKIIAMGYHTQRVTGAPTGTVVETHSLATSGTYFYIYRDSGGATQGTVSQLQSWLRARYVNNGNDNFILYPSTYSGSTINVYVGYKG